MRPTIGGNSGLASFEGEDFHFFSVSEEFAEATPGPASESVGAKRQASGKEAAARPTIGGNSGLASFEGEDFHFFSVSEEFAEATPGH